MWEYGGSSENYFDQSHCFAKFSGGFLPVGSKISEITHRERKSRPMACRGRENFEVLGMGVEQYYGVADSAGF